MKFIYKHNHSRHFKTPRVYKIYTISRFHDLWWPLLNAYYNKIVGNIRELVTTYIGNNIQPTIMTFINKHNHSRHLKTPRVYEIYTFSKFHDLWWPLLHASLIKIVGNILEWVTTYIGNNIQKRIMKFIDKHNHGTHFKTPRVYAMSFFEYSNDLWWLITSVFPIKNYKNTQGL